MDHPSIHFATYMGSPEKIGSGISRVVQDLQGARMPQLIPHKVSFTGTSQQPPWKQNPLLPERFDGSQCRTRAAKSAEKQTNHFLNLSIRIQPHLPVLIMHQADRQERPQFPPTRLVQQTAAQPRSQHVQLGLAHRPFQPQQQTVIEMLRIVQPVFIQDQRLRQRTNLE